MRVVLGSHLPPADAISSTKPLRNVFDTSPIIPERDRDSTRDDSRDIFSDTIPPPGRWQGACVQSRMFAQMKRSSAPTPNDRFESGMS